MPSSGELSFFAAARCFFFCFVYSLFLRFVPAAWPQTRIRCREGHFPFLSDLPNKWIKNVRAEKKTTLTLGLLCFVWGTRHIHTLFFSPLYFSFLLLKKNNMDGTSRFVSDGNFLGFFFFKKRSGLHGQSTTILSRYFVFFALSSFLIFFFSFLLVIIVIGAQPDNHHGALMCQHVSQNFPFFFLRFYFALAQITAAPLGAP